MNFLDIFNKTKAIELLNINSPTYFIELEKGASSLYRSLYILVKKEIDIL